MQRGVMRSIARTRAMRFEWQKLVTPMTPKSEIDEWQAKSKEILVMKEESAKTPLTVEPIDWEYWKTQIAAPGVVEQMQKDYEALNFPVIDPYSAEAKEKIAAIEEDVIAAEKGAVHATNEVMEADKCIETINKVKAEGMTWSLEQWQSFIPGLKEQHVAEYEDEDHLPNDDLLRYDTLDWDTATKDLVAGQDPGLGAPEPRCGDMVFEEEEAIAKAGKWSVARAFAGKEERAKILERVEKVLN